jgi:hypothetical protein
MFTPSGEALVPFPDKVVLVDTLLNRFNAGMFTPSGEALVPFPDNVGLVDTLLNRFNAGMFTPRGASSVPFPTNVVLWITRENAVVCTDPFGNLIPPDFVSICPATVSAEPGAAVPIPIRPEASSVIIELTRNPLLSNFAMRPGVGVSKKLNPAAFAVLLDAFLPRRAPAAVVSESGETGASREEVFREGLAGCGSCATTGEI